MKSPLKSTRTTPTPDVMLKASEEAAPHQPPATSTRRRKDKEKSAMLSVRMSEETLEALAAFSRRKKSTQRLVIAEALKAHGVRVGQRDLEDRPLPRRRGGGGE
jgi:hypothetical protein